jgi:hypothetical protein
MQNEQEKLLEDNLQKKNYSESMVAKDKKTFLPHEKVMAVLTTIRNFGGLLHQHGQCNTCDATSDKKELYNILEMQWSNSNVESTTLEDLLCLFFGEEERDVLCEKYRDIMKLESKVVRFGGKGRFSFEFNTQFKVCIYISIHQNFPEVSC